MSRSTPVRHLVEMAEVVPTSRRRNHEGYDGSPEGHLWRATTVVEDMLDALDDLTGSD